MARIRTIKPSFFKSDDVSALPLRARLTWIGLWTQCDDQGRTKDHTKLIKADVWPLDAVSLADIEEDLTVLARLGRIVRYEVDGERYLAVTNWSRHQKINRATDSHIPPPPTQLGNGATGPRSGAAQNGSAPAGQYDPEPKGTALSTGTHGPLTEPSVSPHAGKGREGKGREGTRAREDPAPVSEPIPEPPPQCPKHRDDPDPPPCGPCADARRAHDRWERAEAARKLNAPKCPKHRGQPAHNCAGCRADQLAAPDPEE